MTDVILTALRSMAFFPMELLAAALVFAAPLERRPRFPGRLAAGVLAMLGSLALYTLVTAIFMLELSGTISEMNRDYGPSALVWCSILFGLMVFILWFAWNVSAKEAVYCAACAYLMEHMAYCVRTILAYALPDLPTGTGSPLYFLFTALVYFCGYWLFVCRMVRGRHYATTAVDSLGLSLGVLTVVMVLSVAASQFGLAVFHGIYALVCGVFAMAGQVRQQKQLALQRELDLQHQLWLRQKAQYELSRENIELINRKCHDLKHQVAALKHIRDPEQRVEVINALQQSVMIYDSMLRTGNEILDTVLTEKSLLCNQHRIAFTCIADGQLLEFLDAVDLYTLFGNALDNAIEASEALPSVERMIDLQVRQKVGLVIVRITNRYAGTVELGEDLPGTNKADKGWHGFGLKSIRSVVEKYDGLLDLRAEGGVFTLRAIFPTNQ